LCSRARSAATARSSRERDPRAARLDLARTSSAARDRDHGDRGGHYQRHPGKDIGSPGGSARRRVHPFSIRALVRRAAPTRVHARAEPAPGATSLLWPPLLAPLWAIGLRGESIIWPAWLLGWASLGLLAHETRRLAEGITRKDTAIAAGAMVLAFGGYAWFAASSMEAVPLAWLLVRTARLAAEWGEAGPGSIEGRRRELTLLGLLAPLLRPEGALATLMASIAFAKYPRGGRRLWALAPLAGLALPPLFNWALTGQATSTTAIVKWLPFSPYHRGWRLLAAVGENLELLARCSTAVSERGFQPKAGVADRASAGDRGRRRARSGRAIGGARDAAPGLRQLSGTDCATVAFGAVGRGAAALRTAGFRIARRPLVPAAAASRSLRGAFATHLPYAIDDVAASADAIRRQQASLGHWAATACPRRWSASTTPAPSHLSNKRIFDVGLTTRGEARYWATGSRFGIRARSRAAPHALHRYPEWLALPPCWRPADRASRECHDPAARAWWRTSPTHDTGSA
jgi:hypothetical protein